MSGHRGTAGSVEGSGSDEDDFELQEADPDADNSDDSDVNKRRPRRKTRPRGSYVVPDVEDDFEREESEKPRPGKRLFMSYVEIRNPPPGRPLGSAKPTHTAARATSSKSVRASKTKSSREFIVISDSEEDDFRPDSSAASDFDASDEVPTSDEDDDAAGIEDSDVEKVRPLKSAGKPGKGTGKGIMKRKDDPKYKSPSVPCGLSIEPREGDLPPISKLADIFDDMVSRMKKDVTGLFGDNGYRKLRVATMCSGTESPLLALNMISRSLKKFGLGNLDVEHVFSCEIEPYKQAYIQRNFKPPILFRDIRELGQDYATTAYGAKVKVPGDVDILIAGTSCVDFSNLNNRRKDLGTKGESTDTFIGMMDWVEKHRPLIVIQENIKGARWPGMREYYLKCEYSAEFSISMDTKKYYIPHTRQRGYLFALDKKKSQIPNKWVDAVKKMERPASSTFENFMLPDDDPRVHRARLELAKEEKERGVVEWERCEIRHHRERLRQGLGTKKPLTQWVPDGQPTVLDFMWQDWAKKQVQRVLDLMDINFLMSAKLGHDPTYKAGFWNLSQNVDRNTMGTTNGICPCLTPTMIPYMPYRGGPMVGYESLHLQGLPIDELLLTREKTNDLQNLAGNAMSSTVVGSAMLAALVLSRNELRPADGDEVVVGKDDNRSLNIVGEETLTTRDLDLSTSEALEVEKLLANAKKSARMCICEGRTGMTTNALRVCQECGFSSCDQCGKRPLHSYVPFNDKDERIVPLAFEEDVKRVLPMTLNLSNINEESLERLSQVHSQAFEKDIGKKDWKMWRELILSCASDEFRFKKLLRKHIWIAVYESPHARTELILSEDQPEWRIYAISPETEGASSRKRALGRFPLLRMTLKKGSKDAFSGSWDVCLPCVTEFDMTVEGSGEQVDCWQKKVGLTEPEFQKTVHSYLTFTVPESDKSKLDIDISGKYKLIDECGTACGALHRRIDGPAEDPPLYFFLEQERVSQGGKNVDDSFIFATTHHRLEFTEERPMVARLPPSWRQKGNTRKETVKCQVIGKWVPMKVTLAPPTAKTVGEISAPGMKGLEFTAANDDCATAQAVINVRVPLHGQVESVWSKNTWTEVDDVHQRSIFEAITWLTERIRSIDGLQDWRRIPLPNGLCNCEHCAPRRPELKWAKNKAGKFVPVEDTEQAGPYERALKSRPKPIVSQLKLDDQGYGILNIGLNVPALIHRALAALPSSDSSVKPELSWRLITDYIPELVINLPGFKLTSNKNDAQHDQPPNFSLRARLRPEQLRSLSWMLSQEREDGKPFMEEEVSEALLPEMNWRLEGRVRWPNFVRGGVLADQVGYGKTAITLGLIDCTQSRIKLPEQINGLIPAKATLIIVPSHLCDQWPSEIRKFLGNKYKIIVLKQFGKLRQLTAREILKADIIVATATLFKSSAYLENTANFAGSVSPPATEGRRFLDWQSKAIGNLHDQVNRIREKGTSAALQYLREVERAKHNHENAGQLFKQTKRKIGSAYVKEQEEAMTSTGAKRKRSSTSLNHDDSDEPVNSDRSKKSKVIISKLKDYWGLGNAAQKSDWTRMSSPPLDMFHFNRVVVDEFTYYDGQVHAGIISLQGSARWVLSGTPPIADFANIKSIAVMLNIHLGIDDFTVGEKSTLSLIDKGKTAVEKFTSFNDIRSPAWHTRRWERAQAFLDKYTRQNIAEIDEIPYEEHIVPIILPPAERAIYLELDHYLRALEYQMRRAKNKVENDRDRRLQESLGSSKTAEEALIKRCSHFHLERSREDEENAVKACDVIVRERKAQLANCREDIRRKLRNTMKLHKEIPASRHEPRDFWTEFVETMRKDPGLGDADANIDIRALLDEVTAKGQRPEVVYSDGTKANSSISKPIAPIIRKPKSTEKLTKKEQKELEEAESKIGAEFWPETMDDKLMRIRAWTTALRTLCFKELAPRHRSLRYFTVVRDLQQNVLAEAEKHQGLTSLDCKGCGKQKVPVSDLVVLSTCGHHGCLDCVKAAVMDEKCIEAKCSGTASRLDAIVRCDGLGAEDPADGKGRQHGKKLEEMVRLIKNVIPPNEKVLLFVQYDDLLAKVQEIFDEKNVRYDIVTGSATNKSKTLTRFQELPIKSGGSKVLLVNVVDESAAGSNLTCANHAIFLSPLLFDNQYDWESRETQAIGRVRRYGQDKKVHVWRFLSMETKDVEVFEQRSGQSKDQWYSMTYDIRKPLPVGDKQDGGLSPDLPPGSDDFDDDDGDGDMLEGESEEEADLEPVAASEETGDEEMDGY